MTTVTETIPFDFTDIYAYIEDKFDEAGYDTEEGSSTMQLVTSMSYLVSMLNANTATNINETLLTLARKRSVMLQDARVLGYEISHIQSYQYNLDVLFENDTASDIVETIDKYTKFTAGDYSYYYMDDTIEINILAGESVTKTITVKEGILYSYDDEDTLTISLDSIYDEDDETWNVQTYVDVPFTNVEKNGVEMFVKYYDDDGFLQYDEWSRTAQFMIDSDTVLSDEFVRLDDLDYGTPRLYFKIGDVGNDMRAGSIIQMNVITSNGDKGMMTETPVSSEISGSIVNYTLSIQGAAEETKESIRINAPLFNNSANRVVTKADYTAFSNRQTTVKSSFIWDGNDEYPTRKGEIWFSFIPSTITRELNDTANVGYQWDMQNLYDTSNWYVEDDEITDIWTAIEDHSIPTLDFNHRHPIYMDFSYEIKIARYSIKTSVANINESVYTIINDYFRDEMDLETNADSDDVSVEIFNYEYFQSNLIKRIDSQLTDSMGFDVVLNTNINLSEKNVITEIIDEVSSLYNKEIRFHLGVPYEDIFDVTDDIIFDKLPTVTTENIFDISDIGDDNYNRKLYIDENTIFRNTFEEITTIDIKLTESNAEESPTDDVVGSYKIFNNSTRYIEVVLFISDAIGGTSSYDTGIDLSYLTVPVVPVVGEIPGICVDVDYPSSNIPVSRNTIPRLKQVLFN